MCLIKRTCLNLFNEYIHFFCTSMLTLTKWSIVRVLNYFHCSKKLCFSCIGFKEVVFAGAASKGQRSFQTHPVSWKATVIHHTQIRQVWYFPSLKIPLNVLTMCQPFHTELWGSGPCMCCVTKQKRKRIKDKACLPQVVSWKYLNIWFHNVEKCFVAAQVWFTNIMIMW